MKLALKGLLKQFRVCSTDNRVYRILDLEFNSQTFGIESLEIRIGERGFQRNCYLSPKFLSDINITKRRILTSLSGEKIWAQTSIPNSENKDVFDQEGVFPGYFFANFHYAFTDSRLVRADGFNSSETDQDPSSSPRDSRGGSSDLFHSAVEVRTYKFKTKGDIEGRIYDWILDTETWKIPWVCLSLGSFWARQNRLVSTQIIEDLLPNKKQIRLDLKDKEIFSLRPFDPNESINASEIVTFYDYFGRPHRTESA